jgi:hypothetical protein
MENEKEIKVGHKVKDIVNNIEGIAVGRTQWLTGCDTIVFEPVAQEKKKQESYPLDINRCEFVDEGVREKFFPEEYKPKVSAESPIPKPGGPHDQIMKSSQVRLR